MGSLALQSDQHAGAAMWQWDGLDVGTLDVACLARLPVPSGDKPVPMACREITIDNASIGQVRADCMLACPACTKCQRRHMRHMCHQSAVYAHACLPAPLPTSPYVCPLCVCVCVCMYAVCACMQVGPAPILTRLNRLTVTWDKSLTITLPWSNDPTPQLTLLNALRLNSTNKDMAKQVTLKLTDWPLLSDTTAIEQLRSLPAWGCTLDLSQCVWPDDSMEQLEGWCTKLAQCVPVAYVWWVVPVGLSQDVWDGLCEGVCEHRVAQGCEGRVAVAACEREMARFRKDMGEGVTVWATCRAQLP